MSSLLINTDGISGFALGEDAISFWPQLTVEIKTVNSAPLLRHKQKRGTRG